MDDNIVQSQKRIPAFTFCTALEMLQKGEIRMDSISSDEEKQLKDLLVKYSKYCEASEKLFELRKMCIFFEKENSHPEELRHLSACETILEKIASDYYNDLISYEKDNVAKKIKAIALEAISNKHREEGRKAIEARNAAIRRLNKE